MLQIEAYNFHALPPEVARQFLRSAHQVNDRLVFPSPVSLTIIFPEEAIVWWPQVDFNPFAELLRTLASIAASDRWDQWFGPHPFVRINDAWRAIDAIAADSFARPVLSIGSGWVLPRVGVDGGVEIVVVRPEADGLASDLAPFAILQQFIAAALGLSVGRLWSFSATWTTTRERIQRAQELMCEFNVTMRDPYRTGAVHSTRIFDVQLDRWVQEVKMFASQGEEALGYTSSFIRRVAAPMLRAWSHYVKYGPPAKAAIECLNPAIDWHSAAIAWLERRKEPWTKRP